MLLMFSPINPLSHSKYTVLSIELDVIRKNKFDFPCLNISKLLIKKRPNSVSRNSLV